MEHLTQNHSNDTANPKQTWFALDLPCVKVAVPYTDFKYHISQNILSNCQDDWNGVAVNKLHCVKLDKNSR